MIAFRDFAGNEENAAEFRSGSNGGYEIGVHQIPSGRYGSASSASAHAAPLLPNGEQAGLSGRGGMRACMTRSTGASR
jgi:hypothetical protein